MDRGAAIGALEIRASGDGSAVIEGAFPYGSEAEIGPGRRETFAPRAFRSRIEAGEEVFLLAHHDMAQPLASTRAGSLTLTDSDSGLALRAEIAPEIARTVGESVLATVAAGLTRGLSPGFRVPPGGAETRDGLRTIRAAELFELSIVAMPAYPAASVSRRSALLTRRPALRWRA